jgi:hypothetical protein
LITTLTKSGDESQVRVEIWRCEASSSQLESQPEKLLDASDVNVQNVVEEVHAILKSLPTEDPTGSEDIYQPDTSICWGSEDLYWFNGSAQGCGGGISDVQAKPEQRATF